MKDSFFMVYVENSQGPTYKHETYESAFAESKRLAETLRLKTYVLQSLAEVELTKFQVTPMRHKDDLPF